MAAEYKIPNVIIYGIERRTLSTNGNPRFNLFTNNGTFQTQTDASFNYGIENHVYKSHWSAERNAEDGRVIGNPINPEVTLLVTKAGKVYGIEYNGKVLG